MSIVKVAAKKKRDKFKYAKRGALIGSGAMAVPAIAYQVAKGRFKPGETFSSVIGAGIVGAGIGGLMDNANNE